MLVLKWYACHLGFKRGDIMNISTSPALLFSPEFVTQLKLPAKNWRYLPFFSQPIKEYKIAAEKYEALLKKGS